MISKRVDNAGPKDQLWAKWNLLSGDERHAYFEHADMLVKKGYLDNPDNRDILDIALSIFASKSAMINKDTTNSNHGNIKDKKEE